MRNRTLLRLVLLLCAGPLSGQTLQPLQRGSWVAGPRLNRFDLSPDAATPAILSIAESNQRATVYVACNSQSKPPAIELRASAPAFAGASSAGGQAQLTLGDNSRMATPQVVSLGNQILFVFPLSADEVRCLDRDHTNDLAGISIRFRTTSGKGLIAGDLPSRDAALDSVFAACRVNNPPQPQALVIRPLPTPQISHSSEVISGLRDSSSSIDKTLDLLAENAKRYSSYVSKVVCKETVHSEQVGFRMGPVHWVMDTSADFSVPKTSDPFAENRVFTTKDGVPVVPPRSDITLPYKMTGAFGPPLSTYLSPDHRGCLHITLSRGRLEFKSKPGIAGKGACRDVAPLARGFLTFEPETGKVLHLERSVPNDVAGKSGFATYGSIDFTPVSFEGVNYQLPFHVIGKKQAGQIRQMFDAHYSGCQLYDVKSSLILSAP